MNVIAQKNVVIAEVSQVGSKVNISG